MNSKNKYYTTTGWTFVCIKSSVQHNIPIFQYENITYGSNAQDNKLYAKAQSIIIHKLVLPNIIRERQQCFEVNLCINYSMNISF